MKIALRSAHGTYLTADKNLDGVPVRANRALIGPWESWEVCDVDGQPTSLRAGIPCALKSDEGQGGYCCAEDAPGHPVVANRPQIGAWETWVPEAMSTGWAFRSAAWGLYLVAEDDGDRSCFANRYVVGAWETFEVISQESAPQPIGPAVPIRTDLLELRGPSNERIYHSIFPGRSKEAPDEVAHWLDAVVAAGYTHVVAEVAHTQQSFVPGDFSYDFLDDPVEFLVRCRPAFDRGLWVIAEGVPEGAPHFDRRRFLERQYPALLEVVAQHPLVMAHGSTELNELFPLGWEIMEMAAIHHHVAPDLYLLIHFNTGYAHPPGAGGNHDGYVGFRDFWWKGVAVKGKRYAGMLAAHPKSALAYQYPKHEPVAQGFLSTLKEVRSETIALAVTRQLPLVAGEYSHLQTAAAARARGVEAMRAAPILGFMNGGPPLVEENTT